MCIFARSANNKEQGSDAVSLLSWVFARFKWFVCVFVLIFDVFTFVALH